MKLPFELQPDALLSAYASGIFPMGDDRGEIRWYAPDPRAIIELDGLVVSRSLRTAVRRGVYRVTFNRAFGKVMRACADREDGTWISAEIVAAYTLLHRYGFAHSVEAWEGDALVGGLYGVSLGGAFFGESMFHRATDASKVALVHLVRRMQERGFVLLDVQFMTDHLRSLGATEVPRAEYEQRLGAAIELNCAFGEPDRAES